MCACASIEDRIGAYGIANKHFRFSPIECVYRRSVMTGMTSAYGYISMK